MRLVLLGVLLILGLAALWQARQRPQRLFEEASSLMASDPSAADRLLEEAVAAAGGQFPEAQLTRCQLLASQGLGDEALGGFSDIRDPASLPARDLSELAEVARASGSMLLAELALKAAHRPGPDLPDVLRQSIRFHLETDQNDRALEECQELLKSAPDDVSAWQVQGAILPERKRPPEAETAFREALKHPSSIEQQSQIREQLTRVLLDQGRTEEARQELDLLREASPLTAEARLMDADVDRLQGDWGRARQTVDWLLANAPASELQARLPNAMLWIDQREPARAIPDLEIVVVRQP